MTEAREETAEPAIPEGMGPATYARRKTEAESVIRQVVQDQPLTSAHSERIRELMKPIMARWKLEDSFDA